MQGLAVVVISSYLPEIMNLSDRILVCRQGRIVEELSPDRGERRKDHVCGGALKENTMAETWTYWRGDWHQGDLRILGASSHATWLGSLVFDGARLFDGVTPDLDRHCARVNASALALRALAPTLTGEAIEAADPRRAEEIRPRHRCLYPPDVLGRGTRRRHSAADPSSTDFALCLEDMPMDAPTGFTITTTRFRRPTMEVMPVNAKAACLYANNARMLREAQAQGFQNALTCDANGNVAELATANVFMARGGEVFTPDSERHLPERHHPPAGDRPCCAAQA